MLDAHTREPITVITQKYLGVSCFCRWSELGHHQKSALFVSEIRVERSHSMFCTNRHKFDMTTVLWSGGAKNVDQAKTMEFNMLHRHLIFSIVYWYNRHVLLLLMIYCF